MLRLLLVANLVALLSASASATTNPSFVCRSAIAQQSLKLTKTALRVLDSCHGRRDKGKFAGDCNSLTTGDIKNSFAEVSAKASIAIDRKCAANDPVRNNYDDGHYIAPDLAAAIRAAVEASGLELQKGKAFVSDKQRAKCRKAIGQARSAIGGEILNRGTRCQKSVDKSSFDFGAVLVGCIAQPTKTILKVLKSLTKNCRPPSDDVSCEPFPGCVITSATTTGQTLLSAAYGKPATCGDGVSRGLEACDDSNLVDGDGCDSNCSPTGCGNGVITAGEQCDDGNIDSCDGCSPNCTRIQPLCGDGLRECDEECDPPGGLGCSAVCTVPKCGNGTKEALELCDDGNKVAGDGCEPDCTPTSSTPPPLATLLGYINFQRLNGGGGPYGGYHLTGVGYDLDGTPRAVGTDVQDQGIVKVYYGTDWILGPVASDFVLFDSFIKSYSCGVWEFSLDSPNHFLGKYREMQRVLGQSTCDGTTLSSGIAIEGYYSTN